MEGLSYCRHRARGNVRNPVAPPRASTKRSFYVEMAATANYSPRFGCAQSYIVSGRTPPCKAPCGRDEPGLECRPLCRTALFIKEGLVTEFFTRETWRRGKKSRLRKRTKPFAGRKTAPAAFLKAAKQTQFRPGRPGCRLCCALRRDGRSCGRLALREFRVCEAHGGFGMLAMQGKFQPSGRSAAFRAATVEGRSPPAPFDLMRLRLYQEADERTRMRLVAAWQTPSWPVLVRQIQLRNI